MVCVASWKKGERFFHVHTILDRRRGEKKGVVAGGRRHRSAPKGESRQTVVDGG